jgi:putative ABC transport system substrate-binding protein
MRRREFITLIGSAAAVSLLLAPVVRAQEPGRIYRLGVIGAPARQAPRIVAFFDELKGLGFDEGHNLQIVAGGFGLREDQFREVAATVARSAPDVIFCSDEHAVRAIQEAIHTVPIVGFRSDVRSLARPGGNTTGVSILAPELDGKRQEI